MKSLSLALADTGASTMAKFYAATFELGGSAAGASAGVFANNFNPNIAGATVLNGWLRFDFTDPKGTFVAFEGFILSGKLSATGKAIAIEN